MAATTEKKGCLSLLFPFLGGKDKASAETLPYRLRDDFLSPAELSFYKVLSTVLDDRFTIQSKVRLADIFFVSRFHENISYFNKIAQRHLDFLICDANTMKPLLGIELDDASHQKESRKKRDRFVEEVFQAAQLPLVRFRVQRAYNTREIAAQIAPFLKDEKASSSVSPQAPTAAREHAPSKENAPTCPKCGIPMVLRTVKQGKLKGKQFYGCANYPHCREIKPAPIQKAH